MDASIIADAAADLAIEGLSDTPSNPTALAAIPILHPSTQPLESTQLLAASTQQLAESTQQPVDARSGTINALIARGGTADGVDAPMHVDAPMLEVAAKDSASAPAPGAASVTNTSVATAAAPGDEALAAAVTTSAPAESAATPAATAATVAPAAVAPTAPIAATTTPITDAAVATTTPVTDEAVAITTPVTGAAVALKRNAAIALVGVAITVDASGAAVLSLFPSVACEPSQSASLAPPTEMEHMLAFSTASEVPHPSQMAALVQDAAAKVCAAFSCSCSFVGVFIFGNR